MVSLLTIPLELLVEVSSYLPTTDLGALRLTCKQIEKSLYEWFSEEFFTKKQFMLTTKSLQTLVNISTHASFSKKLSHVIIATNVYHDYPPAFRDSDAGARYMQGMEDQASLLAVGISRDMLTEAFQNLENLRTVGIRDFGSNRRLRDGISWSSWGATTVQKDTGVELTYTGQRYPTMGVNSSFVSLVFKTLLSALGKAERTPETIEVLLRHAGLGASSFNVPECLERTIEPVLRSLKTLLLNVDLEPGKQFYSTINNFHTPLDVNPGRTLRRFLSYTSNLTHLRLNFQISQFKNTTAFLEWLSLPSHSLRSQVADFFDPPPVDFPNLTTLDIGQVQAWPKVILGVIAKFAPTLQDISLWKVTLNNLPGYAYGDRPNIWANFFKGLAQIPALQLQHLKVGMLKQENIYVAFKDPSIDNAPLLKVKEYSGAKMDAFIKVLEEEALVSWPTTQNPTVDEDEEMDDEDGDEDEYDENSDDEDEDEEDENLED